MARSLYGGRLGDTVVSLFAIGSRQVLALPVDQTGAPVSTVLEVYDEPDGTQLTDLLAADGSTPITDLAVPPDGQIPAFYGPNGYSDDVWLLDPDGDYYRLDVRSAVGPAGPAGPTGPAGADGTGTGDVNGPASATNNRIPIFDGTTGKLIKDSGVSLSEKQDFDTDLTAIAALVSAANKLPYATGVGTWGLADFTAAGRALVDDADAAAQRATLEAAGSTGGGREKSAALSATTGTCTGNLANASVFTISPTGNWTLAFSNVPASGTACTVTVIVSESATTRTMTQPSGVTFIGTAAPTVVASKVRIYTYLTVNGGTTWYASAAVQP